MLARPYETSSSRAAGRRETISHEGMVNSMIAMLDPAVVKSEPSTTESVGVRRSGGKMRTLMGVDPASVVEVSVDLAAGMTVHIDRCVGDVPVLELVNGAARVFISPDAGDV